MAKPISTNNRMRKSLGQEQLSSDTQKDIRGERKSGNAVSSITTSKNAVGGKDTKVEFVNKPKNYSSVISRTSKQPKKK